MRPAFIFSLMLTLVFSFSYWYSATAHICPIPLGYRVGTIDERFNLSQTELETILEAAAGVWEVGTGQDLFVFDEQASLTVDLIFDERQQLARTEEEWSLRLDAEQANYELQLRELRQAQAEYESLLETYNTARQTFAERQSAYNLEVETFNQTGGAPAEAFERLAETERELRTLSADLSAQERRLSKLVSDINQRGEEANALIAAYNAEVEAYNELFGQRETITQGEFSRDSIAVYKFADQNELTRVLAHEFGHALGIGHVEGETSVMYYLTTETSAPPALSDTDRAAFAAVCGEADTLPAQVRRMIRTLINNFT